MIYNLTKHAARRMNQRGIGMPTLRAVLMHGEVLPGRDPYKQKMELLGFRAVVTENVLRPGTMSVLTVYERGESRRSGT